MRFVRGLALPHNKSKLHDNEQSVNVFRGNRSPSGQLQLLITINPAVPIDLSMRGIMCLCPFISPCRNASGDKLVIFNVSPFPICNGGPESMGT